MANHCYNYITITEISEENKKGIIEFFNNYKKHDYVTRWYNEEFGTKILDNEYRLCVGARWVDFELEGDTELELIIRADSAWAPIVPLVKALAKKYEGIYEMEYSEPGCDIAGTLEINDGIEKEWETNYLSLIYNTKDIEDLIEELESHDFESLEELEEILKEIEDLKPQDKEILIKTGKSEWDLS